MMQLAMNSDTTSYDGQWTLSCQIGACVFVLSVVAAAGDDDGDDGCRWHSTMTTTMLPPRQLRPLLLHLLLVCLLWTV